MMFKEQVGEKETSDDPQYIGLTEYLLWFFLGQRISLEESLQVMGSRVFEISLMYSC